MNNVGSRDRAKFSKNLAVIGHPLLDNMSAALYSYLIGLKHINAGVNTYEISEGAELPILMHFLERFRVVGIDVQAPYKGRILQYVEHASDDVLALGYANVLVMDESKGWIAENTEVDAFKSYINRHGIEFNGKSVLIVGAGATATAIIAHLSTLDNVAISVVNRGSGRGDKLKDKYIQNNISVYTYERLKEADRFDIIINATQVDWGQPIWLNHFWGEHSNLFPHGEPDIAIDMQYIVSGSTSFLDMWKTDQKYDGFSMLAEVSVRNLSLCIDKNIIIDADAVCNVMDFYK